MERGPRALALGAVLVVMAAAAIQLTAQRPAMLSIDYPLDGSVFPPEFPAPQFLFRDAARGETAWQVEAKFSDDGATLRERTAGPPPVLGEIDKRAIAPTNALPTVPRDVHAWRPSAALWAAIKKRSVERSVTITISGYAGNQRVSSASVSLRTSRDPVGAPIFYRDVPLIPSETEKGVIKPIPANAVPLIAWRLRDVAATESRVLMQGIYSCANCHSFSADGKTLGMDIDGPLNDKGLYALAKVEPRTAIRNRDVIAWSTHRGKLGGRVRVGFMSQVSPEGRYVVTTINDNAEEQSDYQRRRNPKDLVNSYYVAGFKDYRFLQVFYPTRGVLAWFSRETNLLKPLPGAGDPRFVHTNAVWSPDGKYLVFARAAARDAYPAGRAPAAFANDPNETQIQYDLYRIPFNDGRGGTPEPIAGASQNGMSNSFPKISPDGRWIVYVQCRNGQLMRPDSQLYIVPATGGTPRRMTANTTRMNSWHSFSPNGRWMVFSSKSRSHYTQMFLTHIDERGNDTPAILIENSTAANRAVNIPEFVNVAPQGLLSIDAPATEYFRLFDVAASLANKGDREAAIAAWRDALALEPSSVRARFNLANALSETGRLDEAIAQYKEVLGLAPDHLEAHNNLGNALVAARRRIEAIAHFERVLALDATHPAARANLGAVLVEQGRMAEAIPHLEKAAVSNPRDFNVRNNLGIALASTGRLPDAIAQLEKGVALAAGKDAAMLDLLARMYAEASRFKDALATAQRAYAAAEAEGNYRLMGALKVRIETYRSRLSAP